MKDGLLNLAHFAVQMPTVLPDIGLNKLQLTHSVNGNRSKTAKIIKSDITHEHIA